MKRYQLTFTGRVQGVGFRWTAHTLADSLGLTGWVSNEWDGSVLMEVQGSPQTIERLISGLKGGTFIEIENIERQEIPVIEGEKYFKIKE
ncbi:MAG: acylphosphatase [Treponema sp.]|nr:acylphosphatase [Treponema sp.]